MLVDIYIHYIYICTLYIIYILGAWVPSDRLLIPAPPPPTKRYLTNQIEPTLNCCRFGNLSPERLLLRRIFLRQQVESRGGKKHLFFRNVIHFGFHVHITPTVSASWWCANVIINRNNLCRPLPRLRPSCLYCGPQKISQNDKKKTSFSLENVHGPWEPPSTDPAFTSICDGPARYVVIKGIQVFLDRARA